MARIINEVREVVQAKIGTVKKALPAKVSKVEKITNKEKK